MVTEFQGKYRFLSNFYNSPFMYDGIVYQNSEAAFQAQKTLSYEEREKFKDLDPSSAKRLGRRIQLRANWDQIKDDIMFHVVLAKFRSNAILTSLLLETGDQLLVEGNTWGDTYWGQVNGRGENKLGQILMEVRSLLRTDSPADFMN